jgi:putative transposase
VFDHQDVLFAEKYTIKSPRLVNWNYSSPGYYHLIICCWRHNRFLGKIENGNITLSIKGKVVKKEIEKTFAIRKNILLEECVIMPNHVHLLIKVLPDEMVETHRVRLIGKNDEQLDLARDKSVQIIPNMVKMFKASVSSVCKKQKLFFGWQARYYDEIIKDKNHYWAVKNYIKNNVRNWDKDEYNRDVKIGV